MATRRMFSKEVTDSDAFLELSRDAQLLWFHLGMVADDDGLTNSVKRVLKVCEVPMDAVEELERKGFLLDLGGGVKAIAHWKLNNYIQKDRYRPTNFKDALSRLELNEDKVYRVLRNPDTVCIQSVSEPYPQDRLGEDSLEEDRPGKGSKGEHEERGSGEGMRLPSADVYLFSPGTYSKSVPCPECGTMYKAFIMPGDELTMRFTCSPCAKSYVFHSGEMPREYEESQ